MYGWAADNTGYLQSKKTFNIRAAGEVQFVCVCVCV
jgi:hypothetical protein